MNQDQAAANEASEIAEIDVGMPSINPAGLCIPHITGLSILATEALDQSNYTYVPGPFAAGLPDPRTILDLHFCNVIVTYTHPGWHDVINVEIRLPTDDWNGRFAGIGGGALVTGGGELAEFMMMPIMAEGFATATTDGGHSTDVLGPELNDPLLALTSPGHLNRPLVMDIASVALYDTATIGKAVAEVFYGSAPKHSYFFGGSTGGRQGHMLAQRYPGDYDGIIALFPAINWDKFWWSSPWPTFVMDQMRTYPRPCEFDAITAAVIAACDKMDGLEDGIISRVDLCNFDRKRMVERANSVRWRSHDSVLGRCRNNPEGLGWTLKLHGRVPVIKCDDEGSCRPRSNPVLARYWIKKDPSFDISKITHEELDELFHASVNEYDSINGISDPDLSAFKRRGGKILNWHGTVDAAIPFNGSTDYYDRVLSRDPDAADYYRFFLAPGVDHCLNCGPSPLPTMKHIVDWVDNGEAPDTLKASGMNEPGVPVERDLYSLADDGIRTDSVGNYRPVLQAVYPQDSACFAPGWTAAANSYAKGANFWAGNPLCPSGQSVAQTYSSADVTTAICCSDGWGNIFANGNGVSGATYGFWMCDSPWTAPATTVVSGSILSGGIVTPGIATITGPGLVESTAEYVFIYSTITSTSSATGSSSPSLVTTSASSTATTLPTPSEAGLSGGAIAGVSIGCIALLLLVVAGF